MDLNIAKRLKGFIENSRHILNISYKPTPEEFSRSAKIILLGILIIGVSGMIISIIITLIVTGSLSTI
ncbi:MAG: protein translocase SEC61 complex subunit gamma [Candidatus Micrarchaeaceae archaeon]